jgi:hypothetical protein
VTAALSLLALLIAATPAILLVDGPIVHGLVALVAAASLAMVARSIRPGESAYLLGLIRPVAFVAAVPAVWMIVQVLPMPRLLSHPMWGSAATALGKPIAGSISVDTGATLIACCRYLSVVAIVIVALASAIDRQRAERMLFALASAGVVIALIVAIRVVPGFKFMSGADGANTQPVATAGVALGVILTAATAIRCYERYETRRTLPNTSANLLLSVFGAWVAAAAACWIVLISAGSAGAVFAAAVGFATLMAVVLIRRLGLGPWGCTAVASTLLLGAALIAATTSSLKASDVTLAFASKASPAMIAITQRMLADRMWSGTGGGTFSTLLPIHRDVDDLIQIPSPPTAAAALTIELGRPAFWPGVLVVLTAVALLLRGALERGRDSFYPAAGASCLLTLGLLVFVDAGLFGTSTSILAAAALGLAIAQRTSRSSQQ